MTGLQPHRDYVPRPPVWVRLIKLAGDLCLTSGVTVLAYRFAVLFAELVVG